MLTSRRMLRRGANLQGAIAMHGHRCSEFLAPQKMMAAADSHQREALLLEKLDHLAAGDARQLSHELAPSIPSRSYGSRATKAENGRLLSRTFQCSRGEPL